MNLSIKLENIIPELAEITSETRQTLELTTKAILAADSSKTPEENAYSWIINHYSHVASVVYLLDTVLDQAARAFIDGGLAE